MQVDLLQAGFCIWIEAQFCEDQSWLQSSWPYPDLHNTTLEGWSDPWWPQCDFTTSKSYHSSKPLVKHDSEKSTSLVVIVSFYFDGSPFDLLAGSLFSTCHPHVLCLTQKHLTNKLWFMNPLKGVIWGFWWKLRKNLVVSSLSSHAGTSRSCDHLHLLLLWHPKVLTFHSEVKRWQNTLAAPLFLLLLLLHSMSHQMSLCARSK